ncbi:MAG: pilus assembly protein TadG-related protein [Candidatus Dormibacteria bacterium]
MIRLPRRNLGVPPSTRTRQQGQVMVLFSLSLLVLLLAVGIAIDGGFGLLQYRQAQNAADFAAEAGATALQSNCDGALSPAPVTGTQVVAVLDDEVNINSPAAAVPAGSATKHWTAYYLSNTQYPNGQYKPLYAPGTSTPVTVTTSSGVVPVGACGVHISVQPQWPPFIAQIMGVTQLKTVTGASAVNTVVQGGPLTSIVSLGENGAHTILMAGDGQFKVTGTIFDNANGCLDTHCDMWGRPDVIDGKQSGTMTDYGNIESYANPPWDGCFGTASNTPGPPAGSGNPPAPWNSAVCSSNNTTIKYYNWQGGYTQYTSDPLASDASLPQPSSADAYCPGHSVHNYPPDYTPPTPGGVPTYSPGVYNGTVKVTGNANFLNCSQVLGQTGGATSYTGLYDFKKGLVLRPAAAGDTVTGNQVLFFTQQPPDTINGVKNQGNGEPVIGGFNGTCPPSPSNNSNDNCNAVNSPAEQAIGWNPNPVGPQGLNDSVEMGGGGTINLTGPNSGTWLGFLLWQKRNVTANFGFDAMLGDSANITLGGIVYNNSNMTGQVLGHETYWGEGGSQNGIPFVPGGMLVAGFGIDSQTGMTCEGSQPGHGSTPLNPTGCHVTINGLATVDMFQTQGDTILNITGSTFHIPGIQGSAILTQ